MIGASVYFLPDINACLRRSRNRKSEQPPALGGLRVFEVSLRRTGKDRLEDGRGRN
jgi:hypothetical protein